MKLGQIFRVFLYSSKLKFYKVMTYFVLNLLLTPWCPQGPSGLGSSSKPISPTWDPQPDPEASLPANLHKLGPPTYLRW